MEPRNVVSIEQIAALVDFLELHPELALGRCSRSKEGRIKSQQLWTECSNILNNLSSGAKKSPVVWRMYYCEYKSKLLKKVKAELAATGEVPPKRKILTPLQQRLYSILEHDLGDLWAGVRQNHINVTVGERKTSLTPESSDTESENSSNYLELQHKISKQENNHEDSLIKSPINESFAVKRERSNSTNEQSMNECDMYGQLLAQKLIKLDEVDRMILMNNIDNLVFQTVMQAKAKPVSPAASNSSNSNQSLKHQLYLSATKADSHYDRVDSPPNPLEPCQ